MKLVEAQICPEKRNVGSIFVRRIQPQRTDNTNGRSIDSAVNIDAIKLFREDFAHARLLQCKYLFPILIRLVFYNYLYPLVTKLLQLRGMDYLGVIVITCQSLAPPTIMLVSRKFKKVKPQNPKNLRKF